MKKYQGMATYYYNIEAETPQEAWDKLEEMHGTQPDDGFQFFLHEEEE